MQMYKQQALESSISLNIGIIVLGSQQTFTSHIFSRLIRFQGLAVVMWKKTPSFLRIECTYMMVYLTSFIGKQSRVAFSKKQSTPKSGHLRVTSILSQRTPLFRYLYQFRLWLMRVQLKSEPIKFLYPLLYKSEMIALLPDPNSIIFIFGVTNSSNRFLMAEQSTYQSYTSCCSNSYRASQQASSSQSGKFYGQFLLARNYLYLVILARVVVVCCWAIWDLFSKAN